MAKTTSGLPEGFDLNVTSADLQGPASLPGYLDDDPVVSFANLQRQQSSVKSLEVKNLVQTLSQPPAHVAAEVTVQDVLAVPAPARVTPVAEVPRPVPVSTHPQPVDRKRFQINLDVDSERMLEEMLDLLSSQSSENRIKISELFQALLMTLHSAKSEIVLGSLPTRGRWGSATAKAFPVNLAEALREAIVNHEQASGGNPFRKVVGG